ncbi:hypothetical protein Dsin_028983 [Dipteronia sinensis]|uniref:CCHC-type domain-containing protein n=1 Tax=Dipteronia sinensis TaxID=43782 RepID=A0AAD9ZRT9_9ROSI|nr:hypothetical protein Dsin_028983 [Dipteronia sinensis]
MNAYDIASLCNAFSLKEKERPICILDPKLKNRGEQRLALCRVGKILTTKLINRDAFVDVMNRIWRVDGGVEIEPIKWNIFAFYFRNTKDRKIVLNGGPWTFDRATIAFEKPTGTGDVLEMKFNLVDYWVQIQYLPLLCMTEEIGLFLGQMIGEVRDIDLRMTTDISSLFLWVQITIPIEAPLQRSLRVDLLGSGKVTTMLLRYEILLDYCFGCGRIGHIADECSDEENLKEVPSEATRSLHVWLRATSSPKWPFMGRGIVGRMDNNNG